VNRIATERMWGAALTLVMVIAVINVGAKVIAKLSAPKSF
jgi:phosphate transport system permease protein